MKFTYQELADLRAILQVEISKWDEEMASVERQHPGTRKEWDECCDAGIDMPNQPTEIYDRMNSFRYKADRLLRKIDQAEFE